MIAVRRVTGALAQEDRLQVIGADTVAREYKVVFCILHRCGSFQNRTGPPAEISALLCARYVSDFVLWP